jgi:hypothetical protein
LDAVAHAGAEALAEILRDHFWPRQGSEVQPNAA